MAVVVAGKFHDLIASRGTACEADGTHGRFGSRVDETDHFDGSHRVDDQTGETGFQNGRRSETRSGMEDLLKCSENFRMTVAEDHGAPGADVIDVAVPVNVGEVCTFRALNEDGVSADCAECACGTVYAAGKEFNGFGKCFSAFCKVQHDVF